ncbi:MAG: indolepyruvate ferredoxin oxidoreductase subunit alpha [Bacillota bacterium]|nr:indolepyruvate ferredoxin oxidoreductase subunit alpha [Bacillota bacterium]
MAEKVIMSGNEAIARGAYEAGVGFASAYPGTPSTEILENLSKYKSVHSQWANNEKVAVEMAAGAQIGGLRTLSAMKHVGLNVAADPMMTVAYEGVNGGMVIITADDPGMHSSQNEQDNRQYAQLGKLILIEPSDAQECKDYLKIAYELSERFDLVVLFRVTTRVCHSKSIVTLEEPVPTKVNKYEKNLDKYAMLPQNAIRRHVIVEESLKAVEEYANDCVLNRVEYNADKKVGIITSGISYQHAREVFGDTVSYLKLGLTNPMPSKLISEFCESVETVHVIEEGEPFIEKAVKILGYKCTGKDKITIQGELNAEIVRAALTDIPENEGYETHAKAVDRPPVLCAGCPHRGFFYAFTKFRDKLVPMGDIGCYALGVQTPFYAMDTGLCMGGGHSMTIGMAKALAAQGDTRKPIGFLGDSTFFHSGLTSMIDAIHCQANVIEVVLDNSITGMTGHQQNAGTEVSLMGEPVPKIDVVSMVMATGIDPDNVTVVDPQNLEEMEAALKKAIENDGTQVIITRSPCALIKSVIKARGSRKCVIDADKCKGCKACMKIACPSLAFKDKKAYIADPANCTGCGLCMQMCKFDAIEKVGE